MKRKIKIRMHPSIKHWKGFVVNNRGLFNASGLGSHIEDNQYLKNRIEIAFQAGWDAAMKERQESEQRKERE